MKKSIFFGPATSLEWKNQESADELLPSPFLNYTSLSFSSSQIQEYRLDCNSILSFVYSLRWLTCQMSVFCLHARYFLAETVLEEVTFGWPRQRADLVLREELATRLQTAFNSVRRLLSVHPLDILCAICDSWRYQSMPFVQMASHVVLHWAYIFSNISRRAFIKSGWIK